jgi:hypothetical protein
VIDKDYLIERITEAQVLSILEKFGAVPFRLVKEKEIYFKTVCHGGESHKLCYFRETKTFFCYTECGQMSIFNLVMKLKDCSFSDSIRFIANELGISNRHGFANRYVSRSQELSKIDKYIQLRKPKITDIKNLPLIQTAILSYFEDNVFFQGWIDEGISENTMKVFGIRWYEMEKHIIIPHNNILGELVGIRRRSLQEKDKRNKYMPEIIEGVVYKHSLNLNLYGLDMHLLGIKKTKKVVIVESEKSVLLAHEFYGEDAFVVATCGFNISNWHRNILLSLGIEEVILAFDKDFEILDYENYAEDSKEYKDFQRFVNRIYSLAYKFVAFCKTYVLWDTTNLLKLKDSPFDKGKEALETLMKNKIEITTDREE